MKKILSISGLVLAALVLFIAGHQVSVAPGDDDFTPGQAVPRQQFVSTVFVENSDGTDDGVLRLIRSMQSHGLHFYRTASAPTGLFASDDVILLKINAQWAERGGTNTDLLRQVIRAILDHPEEIGRAHV